MIIKIYLKNKIQFSFLLKKDPFYRGARAHWPPPLGAPLDSPPEAYTHPYKSFFTFSRHIDIITSALSVRRVPTRVPTSPEAAGNLKGMPRQLVKSLSRWHSIANTRLRVAMIKSTSSRVQDAPSTGDVSFFSPKRDSILRPRFSPM